MIVEQFRDFLGVERYHLFLYKLNYHLWPNQDLFWWMNREWQAFLQQHPEYAQIDVRREFLICHIHHATLKTEQVETCAGLIDHAYLNMAVNTFPFGSRVKYTGCFGVSGERADVLVCDQCREIGDRHGTRIQRNGRR